MRKNETLMMWKERYGNARDAYSDELAKIDVREELYRGCDEIKRISARDTQIRRTGHLRNIVAENIESLIDSEIPSPKVTARRKCDEGKAKLIEDMLRNETDRQQFEQFNDISERTVPLQGASFWHVEWDSSRTENGYDGELSVRPVHPRCVIPQEGVYGQIEDMDYIFLALPQTRSALERRYGVAIDGGDDDENNDTNPETVTQYIAYFRNGEGGIGRFSWCGETVLCDEEDYQARRIRVCSKCGAAESSLPYLSAQTEDGSYPEGAGESPAVRNTCPYCGGRSWEESRLGYEEMAVSYMTAHGKVVGGLSEEERITFEDGIPVGRRVSRPELIPYYKPGVYPIIMQKNISVYGRFLGDSDCDKISTQQNTVNRLEQKIVDKICQGGSVMTLPRMSEISTNGRDMQVIYVANAADKSLIGAVNLQADISQDMQYLRQVYDEARQLLGITDSYQGRADSTAQSGAAKRFSAAQSAGRLQSKRVMKAAAYAQLFETMFRFKLAYSDTARPVVSSSSGETRYDCFDRYDFLERDEYGTYYWNDRFIFSAETGTSLSNNRERLWEETRSNLASGAFGDPTETETLIMYWSKLARLHYPGAEETREYLRDKLASGYAPDTAPASPGAPLPDGAATPGV